MTDECNVGDSGLSSCTPSLPDLLQTQHRNPFESMSEKCWIRRSLDLESLFFFYLHLVVTWCFKDVE